MTPRQVARIRSHLHRSERTPSLDDRLSERVLGVRWEHDEPVVEGLERCILGGEADRYAAPHVERGVGRAAVDLVVLVERHPDGVDAAIGDRGSPPSVQCAAVRITILSASEWSRLPLQLIRARFSASTMPRTDATFGNSLLMSGLPPRDCVGNRRHAHDQRHDGQEAEKLRLHAIPRPDLRRIRTRSDSSSLAGPNPSATVDIEPEPRSCSDAMSWTTRSRISSRIGRTASTSCPPGRRAPSPRSACRGRTGRHRRSPS